MTDSLAVLASAAPELARRAGVAAVASWLQPGALAACMLADTRFAADALELLREPASPGAQAVAAAFPDAVALAYPAPAQIEHDAPGADSRPLLDHIATRLLGEKLAGLERRDHAQFQRTERGLSQPAFDELAATCARVLAAGLGPALRAAAIHLDIAKTGSPAHRAAWTARGIALDVHNEAAAAILRTGAATERAWQLPPAEHALAIAWTFAHGLAGQHVRGEGPLLVFAPLVAELVGLHGALAHELGAAPDAMIALALDGLHVLNACDTGAVRDGLLDDALLGKLAAVRDQLARATHAVIAVQTRTGTDARATHAVIAAQTGAGTDSRATHAVIAAQTGATDARATHAVIAAQTGAGTDTRATHAAQTGTDALAAQTGAVTAALAALAALAPARDPLTEPDAVRAELAARLRALRAGRHEPAAATTDAVAALADTELAALAPALATCQLWYCEAATARLSPGAQLGVLAAAVGAARRHGVDVARPWHAQLGPLVARLAGDDAETRYRLRLVEAALAQRSIRDLLGGASLGLLGALSTRLSADARAVSADAGHAAPDAIVLDVQLTAEAAALVTLLAVYETRSQAAFHQMLKALCDLYGLRKDDFDRVANEASYLASMNAARSDKERMLDHVRPGGGRIVEVGPGGGVVLDLLEARFPGAEIIGVDLSREVIAALAARARTGGRRWRAILGAAEQLPELVRDVDAVVFCSILHEVYSYTEPRFRLASIERVVRAAYSALRPGGRIVIRDGVRPPPGTRRLRFIAPDARPTFDLYVAQFEGRAIEVRELPDGRVELSAADAMEFLYTYTWGPASFPYEVRELYGVLEYDDYLAHLLAWCAGARAVPIEPAQRSYLQPGYAEHLAGKIELTDERDAPAALPDSNCLLVIEKPE